MADGQHAVPSSGDQAVDEQTEGNASLRPLKQSLQAWPSRVAASILAFALLVALGWSSWQSTRELIESNRWVSHTLEVLYELEQLRSNIMAAETSQRGFALTGDDRFLREYETAIRLTPASLARARELTSDNVDQQRQLDKLAPLIQRRFALLAANLADRRAGGFEAIDVAKYLQGSDIINEVTSVISAMMNEEKKLFDLRRSAQSKSIIANNRIVTIGTALSILVLSSIFYMDVARKEAARGDGDPHPQFAA